MKITVAAALAASTEGVQVARSGVSEGAGIAVQRANPIRRVVTMLQKIQKKVETEGETETELHEKFMCNCKTSGAAYTLSISDGEAKVESLAAGLKASEGQL